MKSTGNIWETAALFQQLRNTLQNDRYENGLRSSFDDIISADDDFFDQ